MKTEDQQQEQQELIPLLPGEYLKQRRLKKKLSLTEVAAAVNLDEKLLNEIEMDQADHIAAIYRKGYIETYACFLQIPADEISTLTSSTDEDAPLIRNIFTAPPTRNALDKWLRASSYLVASLLIGTLAWQFTHEAVRLSQGGSTLPRHPSETDKTQVSNTPVSASIASLGVMRNKDSGSLDTAERAWAAISQPALPSGESRLELRVSADSWIEISDANGLELEMDLLRGGSEKSYRGKPPFRILLGRASAIRLSMDGVPVDLTAHTVDDVAQLSWPLDPEAEKPMSNQGAAVDK